MSTPTARAPEFGPCTYRDCNAMAARAVGRSGSIVLCPEHAVEWDRLAEAAAATGHGLDDTKRFLGFWVRAQGGAARAAANMAGGLDEAFLNLQVTFGLTAEKAARVEALLGEGRSWREIGRDVGWDPAALQQHYEARLRAQGRP